MVETTNYSYRIAEIDDQNFWGTQNYNIDRLSEHRHDGIDSTKLNPYSILTTNIEVPVGAGATSSGWVADAGRFKNTMEVPAAYDMPAWTSGVPPLAFHLVDANGSPQANELGPGTGQQIVLYSPFAPTASLYLLFG